MKPGHSHNTRGTKKLRAEAEKTAARKHNSVKVSGSKHTFGYLSPAEFTFFRACSGINNEWQAKKENYFRTRMIEMMGRKLTDAEYKESDYETRFKRLYPQLKLINALSHLSSWNIFLTCNLDYSLYVNLHGKDKRLLGRLWYLRQDPASITDTPPLHPYAFALFQGLPKLADKILSGPQFTDPQCALKEAKDDLLVYPFGYNLDAKAEFTPEKIRLWNKEQYDGKAEESFVAVTNIFRRNPLGANLGQLRKLVVYNTASFFLRILSDVEIRGSNTLTLHTTLQRGLHFLYALSTKSREIAEVLPEYYCQNRLSNKTHTIPAYDARTLAALKSALDSKVLDWKDLDGLFELALQCLANNRAIRFEVICSLLNNGMAINVAAQFLERIQIPPDDPTSHIKSLLKELLAGFTSKNFSEFNKHFLKPELRGHIINIANWNYVITTPGTGPLALPQHTISTLEAYAHMTQCTDAFRAACTPASSSSSSMDWSPAAPSASSSSSQFVFRG